jgi:hypothetical protein
MDINRRYARRDIQLLHKGKKEQLRAALERDEIAAYRKKCGDVTGHNYGPWKCTICGARAPKSE